MKVKPILTLILLCTLLCGCGMQRFSIGDTGGVEIAQDKRKTIHLFWGIVPIGRKQTFPAYADAKGYVVTTRYNGVDFLVTFLTGGIVGMKTVKYEAKK